MNLVKLNEAKACGLLALHHVGLAVIALAAAYSDDAGPGTTPAAETAVPRTRRTKAQIAEDEAAEKAKSAAAGATAATAAAPSNPPGPTELSFDDLHPIAAKFVAEHGKPEAVKILESFGAERLKDIKPEDRAKAKTAFEAASERLSAAANI